MTLAVESKTVPEQLVYNLKVLHRQFLMQPMGFDDDGYARDYIQKQKQILARMREAGVQDIEFVRAHLQIMTELGERGAQELVRDAYNYYFSQDPEGGMTCREAWNLDISDEGIDGLKTEFGLNE